MAQNWHAGEKTEGSGVINLRITSPGNSERQSFVLVLYLDNYCRQEWYKLLQARKSKRHQAFDVEDDPRSGRPVTDKVYVIFEKVELDRRISSYDVDGELRIDQETVLTLQNSWIYKKARYLSPTRALMNCVLICDSLLKRNETDPFLKRLIIGDKNE
ncbi:hypothetical protein EVAR_102263_1 [Eumeta japonica]|uniref:Uncharacterized protein n=1 Tax=Eumeta variegata TaxID=151549 RepID=A0A4C1ZRF0_EUMVA|nr:hypothetical protein EVAR_102263_1 [Eumeta japonica]